MVRPQSNKENGDPTVAFRPLLNIANTDTDLAQDCDSSARFAA